MFCFYWERPWCWREVWVKSPSPLVFRMCDILMRWVCHAHLLVLLRILPHKAQQQKFMFLASWANSECLLHHGKYHWDIYIIHNLYLWANGNEPSVWKSLYICRTRMWRWYCHVLKAVCLFIICLSALIEYMKAGFWTLILYLDTSPKDFFSSPVVLA